jgi:hypothetical protein
VGSAKKENAALRALFATLFPSRISYNFPGRPDVPVLYVDAPEIGAVYFELDPAQLKYFDSIPVWEDFDMVGRRFTDALEKYPELLANTPSLIQTSPTYGET